MRRGKKRAILAVAHSILIAIYYIIKEDKEYEELGSNFYNRFNKEKKANAYMKNTNTYIFTSSIFILILLFLV